MLINDTSAENTIDINLTLWEMSELARWINVNLTSTAKLLVQGNGCDIIDYYNVQVVLDDQEQKDRLLSFITSCPQDSNFGGVRENEHWFPVEA